VGYEESELVPSKSYVDRFWSSVFQRGGSWPMKTMFSISYDLLDVLSVGEQWDLIQSYQKIYCVHFDADRRSVVMCR